jgi:prepilin-type N-terminal cleavage/methylation domain-containing protein
MNNQVGKLQNDQKGFSAVEVILVLVIVALIGAVGFMVYKNQKTKTTPVASTTTKTATTQAKKTTAPDPYAGWQSYTLKYEKLAFKYPASWTIQDNSASQGLTPNADSVTLTSSDGFNVSIDDGWDGGGDSLRLATDSPVSVTFLNSPAYLVFSHPRCFGTDPCDANALKGAILMLKSSSQYGQNTAGYFPQDKNAHGNPSVNNGGSTMLLSAGYSGTNAKTFTTAAQAQSDPEFKNTALFLQSMHY